MSRNDHTTNDAHRILIHANITAVNIDPALRAIDEALAGWPTSTPGAAAAPGSQHAGALDQRTLDDLDADEYGHLPTARTTPVERFAQHADHARADLDMLRGTLRDAARLMRIAATITDRWATIRTDDTTVKHRLAAADAIWCTNCALHGFHNPRREGGTVCNYCAGFKSDYPQYKTYPPKAVLDILTTRGRVLPADVHRVMRDLKATAKQTKRQAKLEADGVDWRTVSDPTRRLAPNPSAADARRTKRLTA